MPFGLLWCCYNKNTLAGIGAILVVTNAFRPFVVLLPDYWKANRQQVLSGHQCLSAFCGVVTRLVNTKSRLDEILVTNAFRPFVVLLHVL